MTACDPGFTDEELELVTTRQPFVLRKLKQRRPITAASALPDSTAVVHNLPIPNPYLRPLHAVVHQVVTVSPVNRLEWVFKFDGGLDGLQIIVNIG